MRVCIYSLATSVSENYWKDHLVKKPQHDLFHHWSISFGSWLLIDSFNIYAVPSRSQKKSYSSISTKKSLDQKYLF